MQNLFEETQVQLDESQQSLKVEVGKVRELEHCLKQTQRKLSDIESNSLQTTQVQALLARVKFDVSGFTLIRLFDGSEKWYRDADIIPVQEHFSSQFKGTYQVNYLKIQDDLRSQQSQLAECMEQYETRLTRLNSHMEESNATYLKTQEELKCLKTQSINETKARDTFFTQLLDRSSQLKAKLMRTKGRESLNELELTVGKFMELKSTDKAAIELRDHLLDLF